MSLCSFRCARTQYLPHALHRRYASSISISNSSSPSGTAALVRIADLLSSPPRPAGPGIRVAGYVRTIRKHKRIAFASLQDGSSITSAQVVLSPEQAAALSTGSAVIVEGRWLESKGGLEQACELHANSVSAQGDNDATTDPIQKKHHTNEFLRGLPHLRVRTTRHALLLRLRSQVIANVTTFFHGRGFVQAHTPIITSSDCEGAGEVFTVDARSALQGPGEPTNLEGAEESKSFFGAPKYLTVSSQLHLEALAQSVGNVWTLSPTFRAETSDTARHLSEFYMLEAEIAFTDDMHDVMRLVQDLIRHVAQCLQQSSAGNELLAIIQSASSTPHSHDDSPALDAAALTQRWVGLMQDSWPCITYHDACIKLQEAQRRGDAHFHALPEESTGIQTEHERYLADVMYKGPIFVTDYPAAVKPFYMAPSKSSKESGSTTSTVACFDLLLPDMCEIAGGSMREHRLEPLREKMRQDGLLSTHGSNLQPDAPQSQGILEWYMDLRRYGSVPHGGFGLGFDRLLAYLSGTSNARDMVTFPRHHKRCLT